MVQIEVMAFILSSPMDGSFASRDRFTPKPSFPCFVRLILDPMWPRALEDVVKIDVEPAGQARMRCAVLKRIDQDQEEDDFRTASPPFQEVKLLSPK